jgi:hypothetical protein
MIGANEFLFQGIPCLGCATQTNVGFSQPKSIALPQVAAFVSATPISMDS